jgi:hypothetical protein
MEKERLNIEKEVRPTRIKWVPFLPRSSERGSLRSFFRIMKPIDGSPQHKLGFIALSDPQYRSQ